MRAFDLIRSRRTVREFESHPLPADLVEQCLEAATWAPNQGLTQPWRFSLLAPETAAALAAGIGRSEDGGAGPAAALRSAGAAVAVWQQPAASAATAAADTLAMGAALQNLLLCAWDEGVGGLWLGGSLLAAPAVQAAAGPWPGASLVAVVALGYPAAVPPLPRRRPLARPPTGRTGPLLLPALPGWRGRGGGRCRPAAARW